MSVCLSFQSVSLFCCLVCTNKYYGGNISVSFILILQFSKLIHLMFCPNLHCLFPVPHVQLILLCSRVNQKRYSNKTSKIFVSFKSICEWFGFFLDRGTALLTLLPYWHDTIACISSASQLNILEANKVKRLVVLNKTYWPFSFMLAPNSIALGSTHADKRTVSTFINVDIFLGGSQFFTPSNKKNNYISFIYASDDI